MKNSQAEMVSRTIGRLQELFRQPVRKIGEPEESEADLVVQVGDQTLLFECKSQSSPLSIESAIEFLDRYEESSGSKYHKVVVVPYMTPAAIERCRQAGVHWLDLSGNASLHWDGVVIEIEGRPNAFLQRGRPSSPFAPKSSRIARWLLTHPTQSFFQRELARATQMDEGFTSRIVHRLEEAQLLQRDKDGRVRARDCQLLLNCWAEEYDFFKHEIHKGHVAAHSGVSLLGQLAEALRASQIQYAFTGLAAAWTIDRFASFRLVTLYVDGDVRKLLTEKFAFRDEERGANLWLVQPNDIGVFQAAQERDAITCVHPVQAWLDLKAHPERSAEAAEHLRSRLELGTP